MTCSVPRRTALRTLAILCLLTAFAVNKAMAQDAVNTTITLRIDGFTSEERDAVNEQLTKRGDARIAFACVPAGIMVIESTQAGRNADSLRLKALPGLLARLAPDRIAEDKMSLQQAEQLCDTARN
jgi:hypothetical protein